MDFTVTWIEKASDLPFRNLQPFGQSGFRQILIFHFDFDEPSQHSPAGVGCHLVGDSFLLENLLQTFAKTGYLLLRRVHNFGSALMCAIDRFRREGIPDPTAQASALRQ